METLLRTFWIERVERAWRERPLVWLSGVRRVGKTFLARSLPRAEYFDCERPRAREAMEDPETFLDGFGRSRRIVLDEVHRLPNPSEILKIAADHYPHLRILATGSSTLGASAKFRDALAGRKARVWLTPMVTPDLADFGRPALAHRLLAGGLPPFFLAPEGSDVEEMIQEWFDSYWAKDVLELFRVEKRASFRAFLDLVLVESGGIFNASKFARRCAAHHTTISTYLSILDDTHVARVLRPFHTHRATEVVKAPKVYALDTGFVSFANGWSAVTAGNRGRLWEHFVLDEFCARGAYAGLRHWRDKQGHEIDFVLARRGAPPTAIECKWSAGNFEPGNLAVFRRAYPGGRNFLVTATAGESYEKRYGDLRVRVVGKGSISEAIGK